MPPLTLDDLYPSRASAATQTPEPEQPAARFTLDDLYPSRAVATPPLSDPMAAVKARGYVEKRRNSPGEIKREQLPDGRIKLTTPDGLIGYQTPKVASDVAEVAGSPVGNIIDNVGRTFGNILRGGVKGIDDLTQAAATVLGADSENMADQRAILDQRLDYAFEPPTTTAGQVAEGLSRAVVTAKPIMAAAAPLNIAGRAGSAVGANLVARGVPHGIAAPASGVAAMAVGAAEFSAAANVAPAVVSGDPMLIAEGAAHPFTATASIANKIRQGDFEDITVDEWVNAAFLLVGGVHGYYTRGRGSNTSQGQSQAETPVEGRTYPPFRAEQHPELIQFVNNIPEGKLADFAVKYKAKVAAEADPSARSKYAGVLDLINKRMSGAPATGPVPPEAQPGQPIVTTPVAPPPVAPAPPQRGGVPATQGQGVPAVKDSLTPAPTGKDSLQVAEQQALAKARQQVEVVDQDGRSTLTMQERLRAREAAEAAAAQPVADPVIPPVPQRPITPVTQPEPGRPGVLTPPQQPAPQVPQRGIVPAEQPAGRPGTLTPPVNTPVPPLATKVADADQGPVSTVAPTRMTAAQRAKKANAPASREAPVVKRAKDFATEGRYNVDFGDATYQIYRDPESGYWYEEHDQGGVQKDVQGNTYGTPGIPAHPLSVTNRADAIERLKERIATGRTQSRKQGKAPVPEPVAEEMVETPQETPAPAPVPRGAPVSAGIQRLFGAAQRNDLNSLSKAEQAQLSAAKNSMEVQRALVEQARGGDTDAAVILTAAHMDNIKAVASTYAGKDNALRDELISVGEQTMIAALTGTERVGGGANAAKTKTTKGFKSSIENWKPTTPLGAFLFNQNGMVGNAISKAAKDRMNEGSLEGIAEKAGASVANVAGADKRAVSAEDIAIAKEEAAQNRELVDAIMSKYGDMPPDQLAQKLFELGGRKGDLATITEMLKKVASGGGLSKSLSTGEVSQFDAFHSLMTDIMKADSVPARAQKGHETYVMIDSEFATNHRGIAKIAEELNAAINQAVKAGNGKGFDPENPVILHRPETRSERVVEQIASMFGADAYMYRSNGRGTPGGIYRHGVGSKNVFINSKDPAGDQLAGVAFHEIEHKLQETNPEIHKAILDTLTPEQHLGMQLDYTKDLTPQARVAELERLAAAGRIDSEVAAVAVQRAIQDPAFWKVFEGKHPEQARFLWRWFSHIWEKIKRLWKNLTGSDKIHSATARKISEIMARAAEHYKGKTWHDVPGNTGMAATRMTKASRAPKAEVNAGGGLSFSPGKQLPEASAKALVDKAKAETAGNYTVGDPNKAWAGLTDAGRATSRAGQELNKNDPSIPDQQTEAAAKNIADDPKLSDDVWQRAINGQHLNDVQTVAYKRHILDKKVAEADAGKIPWTEVTAAASGYDKNRSDRGRDLRAGRDDLMNPLTRAAHMLQSALSPSRNNAAAMAAKLKILNGESSSPGSFGGEGSGSGGSGVAETPAAVVEGLKGQVDDLSNALEETRKALADSISYEEFSADVQSYIREIDGLKSDIAALQDAAAVAANHTAAEAIQFQTDKAALVAEIDRLNGEIESLRKKAELPPGQGAGNGAGLGPGQGAGAGQGLGPGAGAGLGPGNPPGRTPKQQAAFKELQALRREEAKRARILRSKIKDQLGIDIYKLTAREVNDLPLMFRLIKEVQASKAEYSEMVYEFWINSILSGFKTQIRNALGNSIEIAMDGALRRPIQAAINEVYKFGTGIIDDLAGPKHNLTQVNATGNPPTNNVPGGQQPTSKVRGRYIEGAPMFSEVKTLQRFMGKAWERSTANFMIALKSGGSVLEHQVDAGSINVAGGGKYENSRQGSIPGKAGTFVRTPTHLLMAVDELFKGMIYSFEVAAIAHRRGVAMGLKGQALDAFVDKAVGNMKDDAHVEALVEAERLTLQAPLGRIMGGLTRIRDHIHKEWFGDSRFIKGTARTARKVIASRRGMKGRGLIRKIEGPGVATAQVSKAVITSLFNPAYYFPFMRVGTNMVKRAVAHSPLATPPLMLQLGMNAVQSATGQSERTISGKEATRKISEQMIGWALAMAIIPIMSKLLSGPGEEDDDLGVTGTIPWNDYQSYNFANESANPATSFRAGDSTYSYNDLQPLGSMVQLNKDLGMMMGMIKDGKYSEAVTTTLENLQSQASDKTFAEGIRRLLFAFKSDKGISNLTAQHYSSFMPNAIRSPMGASDNLMRDRYNKQSGAAEGFPKRFMANLLPVSGTQPPPMVNIVGEDMEKSDQGFIGRYLSPVSSKTTKVHPVLSALAKFNANTNHPYKPQPAPRSVSYKTASGVDFTYKMTDQEYYQYRKLSGALFKERLDYLQTLGTVNPDKLDRNGVLAIKKALEDSRRETRKKWLDPLLFKKGVVSNEKLMSEIEPD